SLVKIKNETSNVQNALNLGNWASIVLTAIASFFAVKWIMPQTMVLRGYEFSNTDVFLSIMVGLVVGALMSYVTEYFTSMGKRPVLSIIKQSSTGHATNIIGGLAIGMESTVIPILVLAGGIYGSYHFAGFYGVAIAAAGMMATTAMQLAIDAFGPVADNAGGIAEMSQLPDEVRDRTDNLDAVGNTTAATGKGFAIASAALTSLALFAAFVGLAGIDQIDIYKAEVLAGLFVGGMIPFIFSSLCISAVGRAAMEMVKEVRRQFKEIPGIMEYKAKPEYQKCVAISTNASLKEMMLPGAIAILVPVIIGFIFGPEVLGGLLAGVTVSGVLMGIFQNNAGGAWDNAKKSFEQGVMIDGKMEYKGSEAHKASVTGDTVGDPFKDTSGPSMNILIKLTSIVALIIAPHISVDSAHGGMVNNTDSAILNTENNGTVQTISDSFVVTPDNSTFTWVAKKVTGQHNGTIHAIGRVEMKKNLVVQAQFEIDMESIKVLDIKDQENNGKLTGHLMSDDFFGVDQNPTSIFEITNSFEDGNGRYVFEGHLTVKGITDKVSGIYDVIQKPDNAVITGAFDFDRTAYDIKYRSGKAFSDLGDKMIYDEVLIGFEIIL